MRAVGGTYIFDHVFPALELQAGMAARNLRVVDLNGIGCVPPDGNRFSLERIQGANRRP
jgi:hypothetical protein